MCVCVCECGESLRIPACFSAAYASGIKATPGDEVLATQKRTEVRQRQAMENVAQWQKRAELALPRPWRRPPELHTYMRPICYEFCLFIWPGC